jgi:hypothetical protein
MYYMLGNKEDRINTTAERNQRKTNQRETMEELTWQ